MLLIERFEYQICFSTINIQTTNCSALGKTLIWMSVETMTKKNLAQSSHFITKEIIFVYVKFHYSFKSSSMCASYNMSHLYSIWRVTIKFKRLL